MVTGWREKDTVPKLTRWGAVRPPFWGADSPVARSYADVSSSSDPSDDLTSRHHPRRRERHASRPGHRGVQQAAAPGLLQADDLLPAQHADAGGGGGGGGGPE